MFVYTGLIRKQIIQQKNETKKRIEREKQNTYPYNKRKLHHEDGTG